MKAGFKIESVLWDGCECVHVTNYEMLNEIGFYSFNLDSSRSESTIGRWKLKGTKKYTT